MEKARVNFKKMYYGFPVILISFYDENGNANITTLSSSFTLTNMVCLGFGSNSYAVNQIKKVKDFVINIPDRSMMKEMDICGSLSGRKHKKLQLSGLTAIKSDIINAPIIAECPVSIECSLTDVIEKEHYKGITTILASIQGRLIRNELLNEDQYLVHSALDPVLYVGDDKLKVYRYTEKNRSDNSGSFL